MVRLAG